MARKEVRENYHVRVSIPWESWRRDPEAQQRIAAENLAAAINDIDTKTMRDSMKRNGASVCWDTRYVCEHCNREWTEFGKEYNGGCCRKDEDENTGRAPKRP